MRIAIVSPVYPFRGGIAYFTGCLYRELVKDNHQIKLLNFRQQYPGIFFPGRRQTELDSPFADIPSVRILTPYNPLTYARTLREILAFQPDLVCFSFFLPYFAPAYLYLLRKLQQNKIKTMLLVHNIEFHEKWFFARSWTRKLLNHSELVLTLSESVFQAAKQLVKEPDTKIIKGFHPLYDFHNQARYTRESAREKLGLQNRKVLLFFGYIKPYKGLDLLIKCFPLVKKRVPEAILLIAGEIYGNEQPYRDLIKETGLAEEIILKNEYIGSEEVELYYKVADVLVLPYRQATQSGVLQTAYAMDLGVVVTRVGSLPDMVKQGQTGVVANSLSENELAEAIVQYLSLDESYVRKNITEYRMNFSWAKFAELMVKEV